MVDVLVLDPGQHFPDQLGLSGGNAIFVVRRRVPKSDLTMVAVAMQLLDLSCEMVAEEGLEPPTQGL